MTRSAGCLTVLAVLLAPVTAQVDRVQLTDGHVLVGVVLQEDDDVIQLAHAVLGLLELPRADIEELARRLPDGMEGLRHPAAYRRGDAYRDELRLAGGTLLLGKLLEDSETGVRFRSRFGEIQVPRRQVQGCTVRIDEWGPRTLPPEEVTALLAQVQDPDPAVRKRACNLLLFLEDPAALARLQELLGTEPGTLELRCRGFPACLEGQRLCKGTASLVNASNRGCWIRVGSSPVGKLAAEPGELHPLPVNVIPDEPPPDPDQWLSNIGLGGGGGGAYGGRFGRQRDLVPRGGCCNRRDPDTTWNDIVRFRWLAPGAELELGTVTCRVPRVSLPQPDEPPGIQDYQVTHRRADQGVEAIDFGWNLRSEPQLQLHAWHGEVTWSASVALLWSDAREVTELEREIAAAFAPGRKAWYLVRAADDSHLCAWGTCTLTEDTLRDEYLLEAARAAVTDLSPGEYELCAGRLGERHWRPLRIQQLSAWVPHTVPGEGR